MIIRPGIRRVGRPSLIGSMARTAVVAGTASAVVGGMSRRQQAKAQQAAEAAAYEQQQAAPPPAAPPPPPPQAAESTIDQLTKLAELKQQGILTDAEFEAQKAKILGG